MTTTQSETSRRTCPNSKGNARIWQNRSARNVFTISSRNGFTKNIKSIFYANDVLTPVEAVHTNTMTSVKIGSSIFRSSETHHNRAINRFMALRLAPIFAHSRTIEARF
jgi:hypothetical protein